MDISERVQGVVEALKQAYPDPRCALEYEKDYELMIAVRLSAQCTDARVNLVTPALFAHFPTLDAFADADVSEVEEFVRTCGFFRQKAHDIVAACRMLRDEYGGRVPNSMDALLRLPGVGRKTANLLLAISTPCPARSCATRTASASAESSVCPKAKSRKRWSASFVPSSRRRNRPTSATASSSTAGRSARQESRSARSARCGCSARAFAANKVFVVT